MRHRVTLLAVIALGLIVGVGTTTAVTDGTEPHLSLSIDSKTIENGDKYGTSQNPDLNIEASIGDNVSDDRELEEVVIRVNSDRYRNFSTQGESFSKTVPLDVDTGDNTIRVIVTDSAGRATSITFTVFKDNRRPSVYLTAPYETIPYNPISDGSTTGSWTTFNATIIDASNATTGTITYWWNDTNDEFRASRSLSDMGSNFSQRVFLGYGTNRIRLSVSDEYGNTRIDEFHVDVTDDRSPRIELDSYPTEISQSEFVLSGYVTDDVWVEKARIVATQLDGNEHIKKHIRRSEDYHIDPDRTNVSFQKTMHFLLSGTYRVNLTVRDVSGKWTNRSFRVEQVAEKERPVVPEISINRERTSVFDSETLYLVGRAFDGQIRRLVVESRDSTTGQTIGYYPIFSGTNKPRVEFERNVTIQPNRTEVIVRVTDAEGGEHVRRFFVSGASEEVFVGNESAADADGTDASDEVTPTVTTTREQATTPESTATADEQTTTTESAESTDDRDITDSTARTTDPSQPGTDTSAPESTVTQTAPATDSGGDGLRVLAGLVGLAGVMFLAMLWVSRREA